MTAIPSHGESDFAAGSRLIDKPPRTRRASRAFVRYLIAIGIGVAGTLAWQSYGEAAKQTIAANAPRLGWSPEAQRTIAGWVQELGLTKPPIAADTGQAGTPQAAAIAQTAPEMKADTSAPAAASLEQVQRMAADLAALHQTVEDLTAGQDRMARDIATMQAADEAVMQKVTAPPPPAAAPVAHKHVPTPSTAAPLPLR
ncbi:MAG: hypothetical protein WBE48_14070 [Xanthobacteraceae bacterium]|jgi:hypothetical protein